jgi:hypothetical protein
LCASIEHAQAWQFLTKWATDKNNKLSIVFVEHHHIVQMRTNAGITVVTRIITDRTGEPHMVHELYGIHGREGQVL